MTAPPSELLGLPKFSQWYPGQETLYKEMMSWLLGPERYLGAALPTGYGKSLLAMLVARMSGVRTVYLTSTKGLQAQLMNDFQSLGLVDQRGMNDYQCVRFPKVQVDRAPCRTGYACPDLYGPGCHYYGQLNRTRQSNLVVSNYAYWMAQSHYNRDGLDLVYRDDNHQEIRRNSPELLICDEAHEAGKAIESFMQVSFSARDRVWIRWEEDWTYPQWAQACHSALPRIDDECQVIQTRLNATEPESDRHQDDTESVLYLQGLARRCQRCIDYCQDWVPETRGETAVWTPVWPGRYNRYLVQHVPKVLLMSAMFTKPMMEQLGIQGQWIDSPSPFPVRNTPITHVKTVRVDHRAEESEMLQWVERIDQIIRDRPNQKGLIFTVSYARARFLAQHSTQVDSMLQHTTRNVAQVVDEFKRAKAPKVLVSPSVTTGYDFPDDQCNYIIIGKVPYPDTRAAIVKARQAEDKSWTAQLAMQILVQEAGRGTRSAQDRCQVIIVDDAWKWWWPRYHDLAPRWFRDRVVPGSLGQVPKPI